ncbi:OsmC family protein [Naasia sp. SYSU D00057]|uniref:OsmC family protein n=1 Tax=Naasia sp. SYSU D00057 TaxID=2817380 RepID=UPI001B30B8C2|nr:OsmC family protein [Naasia sp. SYSU D00057]
MRITAGIRNSLEGHTATVSTQGRDREVPIPPRSEGRGSAVNGGELLFLALATCYGNDVYREAAAAGIPIDAVEVTVEGEFGGPGDPAHGITYRVVVTSPAETDVVRELLRRTDGLAEIQNTLRVGTPVILDSVEVRTPAG